MSKANTKEQEPKEQKSMAREILEMVFYLVIALLAALFIVNFVGQRTQVDGHSMDPTLADGQNLILDKVSYRFRDPERYDIIIFKYPDDESQLFIKRLIGLPGDTVEIRNGKVFINGVEDEKANSHVPETPTGNYGPYVVPEGSYFMLGDNREHSKDSRFWQNTFVTYDEIVGKAIVRYYPSIKVLE